LQLINRFITSLMVRVMNEDEEGQGLVEYGLIIVFVSLVAIVGLGLMGKQLDTLFNDIAGKLKGP